MINVRLLLFGSPGKLIFLVFTNDSILAALCQMRESADADERVEFTELFNLFNISEDDEDDKEVEEQPVRFVIFCCFEFAHVKYNSHHFP